MTAGRAFRPACHLPFGCLNGQLCSQARSCITLRGRNLQKTVAKQWKLFFFVICAGVVQSPAWAADTSQEEAIKAVRDLCPNASLAATSGNNGALINNGTVAVPIVVDCERDQSVEIMIALPSQGAYRIAYRSKKWGASTRRWERASISKTVLTISEGCAGACTLVWSNDYKFKLIDGKLTLIGEERRDQSRADDGVGALSDYGSSINYLTGTAVVWRSSSKRRVEKSIKFTPTQPVFLQDFDADEFDVRRGKIKGLDGYIDEKFEYRQLGSTLR